MNLYHYRALAKRVIDGDTFDAVLDLGCGISFTVKIRLYGINAPEIHGETKPAGETSKDWLKTQIEGKTVFVDSRGWDKYGGRIDGIVWIKESIGLRWIDSVNYQELELGLAVESKS